MFHGLYIGKIVQVCTQRCISVRIIDWCSCGSGRVLDLYESAFARLAPPSRGVVYVHVRG
jgi:rare lipoprotein A (peptidoglycan hydrolase)